MSTFRIFTAALNPAFAVSAPFMIAADRAELFFDLDVAAGPPAVVQWFLEFTDGDPYSPTALWRREIAEEDAGGGVVNMPKVIRAFAENGGAPLAAGIHNLDADFVRFGPFCRVQIRAVAGSVKAEIATPTGTQPARA